MCGDADVMRFIGNGSVLTPEKASMSISSFETEWQEKGYGLFAVELKQSGAFIGFAGLSEPIFLPEVLPSVEIGWRLSKKNWGKGYASEAAIASLSFGVDTLGLTELVSICQIGNIASVRIMKKLGLRFSHRIMHPILKRDLEVYRLPKD